MQLAILPSFQFKHWPANARELLLTTAVVLLALLPHVPHLPFWIPLIVVTSLLWRITLELRAAALPSKWLRNGVAVIAMLSILKTFRTLNGLEAGTALLSIMAGMKLLETRDHRDYTILIFIAYFLLFAELLYDQSMWMLPYLLVSTLCSTATLMRLHDGGAHITYPDALKRCTRMALQAAPLALLLFIFFPRLQGQFWALPSRGGATSGLSEEMSPGDVSQLSLSDDIAFRVEFNGDLPPMNQRYWRAVVLHEFNGRTWRRIRMEPGVDTVQKIGAVFEYRLLLEPSNQRWIPVLDVPVQWQLQNSIMLPDLQLLAAQPLSQLTSVTVQSATQYRLGLQLSTIARRVDTQLPIAANPRTLDMARRMYSEAGDDVTYINHVLRMFNHEAFSYTLEPAKLGANAVDDFLFTTHAGFCEHYASAFTVLMRAAGIPARVVTGYQGGEYNSLGNYLIIRQADAHAWSEVWLVDKGWVRLDPTAAIAPERINTGSQSALSDNELASHRYLRQFAWVNSVRMGWDAMNTFWKKHIVQFNVGEQQSLLSKLGIDSTDWRDLGLSLVIAFVLFFFGMLAYLAWRFKPTRVDPVVSLYQQLQRKLEKQQIVRAAHEGPNDFLKRAAIAQPARATRLLEICEVYVALRYESNTDMQLTRRLARLINDI